MARRHAVIFEDDLRIPEDVHTFEGFERWAESDEFPETGRIDYLAGDVEVALSPEDLYAHGAVKTAITATFHSLITAEDRGDVFSDRTRLTSRFADLSVEPDVLVVLQDSLETGRARPTPGSDRRPNRFSSIEGASDVVVEIVSDSSVSKDTDRLPLLYARAGIPELWLIDARGEKDLRFDIYTLRGIEYVLAERDTGGWSRSPRLGGSFRLTRRYTRPFSWRYTLEHRP
jgi:Uma2 family endonuclease